MCIEIEAKLKVDSHKPVEKKLTELGAEFLGEQFQTDYYLDDSDRTLTKADKCLRIRLERVGKSEKFFITYKGPKEKGEFKKRQEVETQVADADAAEKLFAELGYQKAIVVEKKRKLYRLGHCQIALDDLPALGTFVEIEGPDAEKISEAQNALGLAKLPHIPESYACLLADKLSSKKS
jgi:adenylate cyclase class 2